MSSASRSAWLVAACLCDDAGDAILADYSVPRTYLPRPALS